MSSGPLDVSLRIRMRYEADGARRAVADIGQVATQAEKLGGVRTGALGRDLRDAGAAAQATGRALVDTATQAAKLGGSGAGRLGRDLRDAGDAARGTGRALAETATQAAKLGAEGVGRLEAGLKRVEAPARDAARRVEDVGRAAARFGAVSTVSYLERDLRAVAAPADRARRELVAVGDAATRLGRTDGVRVLGRDLAEASREAGSLHRRMEGLHRHHGPIGRGGGVRAARHDFGNEALMSSGLGMGLRFGMGGAAAGGLAAGGAIAATAGAVAKATGEAIKFEAAMAEVRKAIDDLSPEKFAALERTILNSSAATGIAKEQMAGLVAQAGFAGRPAAELARFAEFGAKAAGAFGMTAEATGDALAKMGNVFKLDQAGIEDLANGINVLGDSTAAKEKQIVDFLYRTGSAGQAIGLTALQTGAIGAAIVSTGKEAEVAATGFNAFATKLGTADRQSKDFQGGLRALGLNARQVKKDLAANPVETVLGVLDRINKLPDAKKLDVTSRLGGLEYGDDLLAYAGAVEQMRGALGKLQDQSARAGSVEKTFKIFDATTDRNIARMTASIDGFATRIGRSFTPVVNEAARAVERWFNGMNKTLDRRAEAEALAGRMAKGQTLTPEEQARIDANPRLKSDVDQSLFFQKRKLELEGNRAKAQGDPTTLPSQDTPERAEQRATERAQAWERRQREFEERRQRAMTPVPTPDKPATAAPLPGTGKRSDLSDGARVSLASYHDTVERSLDRTERVVRDAGRRMREDLAIGAKVDLASLMRTDPSQQIRIERASLGGGSLGGGSAGRGHGGGSLGAAPEVEGGGGHRVAPGRFGGLIPPRAGGRSQDGPAGGERERLRDGSAGNGGAHERFGDGGGTRGAARTGHMMGYAMDQLRREGVPEPKLREAAGHLVGQAHMESGLDPNKSHDGGTGYGIYGARDPSPGRGRKTDMFRWLEANGYARNSAEGQMRYMAHEAMSGRYKQTRQILMGEGSGDVERDTNTITKEFESPKVVNRRSGAVRNAMRVGPEDNLTGSREGAGAKAAGDNGQFDPLGGAPRRYSSGYGMREHPVHGGQRMHHGQDMAAPAGTSVHSMQAGSVSKIDRNGDVTVTHADGSTKTYRHISPGGIRQGQNVEAGAPIGRLRQHDPRSTGPHLHMEATDPQGRRYDPRGEIEAAGRSQAERHLAKPAPEPRPGLQERPVPQAEEARAPRELPREGAPGVRSPRFAEPRQMEARARPAAEPQGAGPGGRAGGGFGGAVTQNFYGGFDEQGVARRAQLERNRAVRQASARTLGDVGRPG